MSAKDAQHVVDELKAYRRKLKRFPAGSVAYMATNPPPDAVLPLAIIDGNTALTAVRVLYMNTSGKPTLHIAAESDLQPLEDLE